MLGGVLQLAVQIPALWRIGVLPRIGVGLRALAAAWRHPGVRTILRQMAPALLGVSVAQLSILINTQIASHQGVGAVSWLFYADRLMEFPTSLLGVALGAVLIPQLSAAQARGDAAGYSGMLDWGLRLALLLALPCAAALLVFPEALVATLFQRGKFDAARRRQDGAGAARLRRRPDRPDRRQDPGARLLRAPGHPHAGDDRGHRPGADPGDERPLRPLPRPRRPGAVGEPRGDDQRGLALRRPEARRLVPARARLGPLRAEGGRSRRWR